MGLYFSAAMVRSLMSGLELNVRSSSACSKSRNIAATLGSFDDAIPPSPRTLGYPTSVWIPSGVERESRQVNQPIHKSALATILLNLNVRVVVMWQIVARHYTISITQRSAVSALCFAKSYHDEMADISSSFLMWESDLCVWRRIWNLIQNSLLELQLGWRLWFTEVRIRWGYFGCGSSVHYCVGCMLDSLLHPFHIIDPVKLTYGSHVSHTITLILAEKMV